MSDVPDRDAVEPDYLRQAIDVARLRREIEHTIGALRALNSVLAEANVRIKAFSDNFDKEVSRNLQERPHYQKAPEQELEEISNGLAAPPSPIGLPHLEGKICRNCGELMFRTGSCYTCPACGESDGCG